jgi:hypothetical protein
VLDRPPFVSFLSDYGLVDEFVGVCHAVMLDVTPDLRIVDITHEIAPFDVRAGALALVRGEIGARLGQGGPLGVSSSHFLPILGVSWPLPGHCSSIIADGSPQDVQPHPPGRHRGEHQPAVRAHPDRQATEHEDHMPVPPRVDGG